VGCRTSHGQLRPSKPVDKAVFSGAGTPLEGGGANQVPMERKGGGKSVRRSTERRPGGDIRNRKRNHDGPRKEGNSKSMAGWKKILKKGGGCTNRHLGSSPFGESNYRRKARGKKAESWAGEARRKTNRGGGTSQRDGQRARLEKTKVKQWSWKGCIDNPTMSRCGAKE